MRFVWLLLFAACAEHAPTRVFVAVSQPSPPAPTHFDPPAPKIPDNCDDAIVAYHELLASGKGPNHPAVRAAKVFYDACNSGSPPPGMPLHRPPSPPMPCGEAALERA